MYNVVLIFICKFVFIDIVVYFFVWYKVVFFVLIGDGGVRVSIIFLDI